MTLCSVGSLIRQNWKLYLVGAAAVLGIKCFYSQAGSNELQWILAPTAWWVRILSGIKFEYAPDAGYINHALRFIIAPSCSGVQFMVISFATLFFSFVHRLGTMKGRQCWLLSSLISSYLLTILVNGLRIVLAIRLPVYLHPAGPWGLWLTQERLHTLIGIAVYFTSLSALYHAAGNMIRRVSNQPEGNPVNACAAQSGGSLKAMLRNFWPPIFWYIAIVLGIPLLNRAYLKNGSQFTEYAVLLAAMCLAITALFSLAAFVIFRLCKIK